MTFEGEWSKTGEDYKMIKNESNLIKKLNQIRKQQIVVSMENLPEETETESSPEKPSQEEIDNYIKTKRKYMSLAHKKGKVQIKFYYGKILQNSNKVNPTKKQKDAYLASLKNAKKKPYQVDTSTQNESAGEPKEETNGDATTPKGDEATSQENNKITKDEDTKADSPEEEAKEESQEADKNASGSQTQVDEGSSKSTVLSNILNNLEFVDSKNIPELKHLVQDDFTGLADPSFTYYDYDSQNKLYMVVEFFDDEYSDEHRFKVFLIVNFKNTISRKTKDEKSSEKPEESGTVATEGTSPVTENIDKSGEDEKTENVLASDGSKDEEDQIKDSGEVKNSPDEQDAKDSKNEDEKVQIEVNSGKPIPENLNELSAEQVQELFSNSKESPLKMSMQSAVVEPFHSQGANIRAFKFFNFEKLLACRFQGHIQFKDDIFLKTTSGDETKVNYNMVPTQNLRTMGEIMTLRLFSDQKGCELNLNANLHYKENKVFLQTILFMFFVLTLSVFIIKGGYSMVSRIMDNISYTKTISLFTAMCLNFQDFGFIMFFLIQAMSVNSMMSFYFFLFFVFIFITTFLSMRIMLLIWRVENNFLNNNQIDSPSFRKKFYLFQMKFYFLMLAYYSLMHLLFAFHPILIMTCSLVLYPQIIKNLSVQLHSFDKYYLLCFVLPRFFLLLYFRLCPKNIENLRPYPVVGSLSFLLFLLSLLIIYLQVHYGSYFFIPRFLRWKQFNYFVKVDHLRRQLLGEDALDADTSTRSGFSSGIKSVFSKIFSRKSSGKKDPEDVAEGSMDQKTLDFSIMSKDTSKTGGRLDAEALPDSQFIKTEDDGQGRLSLLTLAPDQPQADEEDKNLCNICMECVFDPDDLVDVKNEDDFDLQSRLFKKLCGQYKNNHRMKTPCSHYFHTSNSVRTR